MGGHQQVAAFLLAWQSRRAVVRRFAMTRWIMLVVTLLGLVLTFGAKTPGLLGIGLLLTLIGVIGFVFALAADRIAANARPEASMAAVEDLAALRRKRAAAPAPARPVVPAAPVAPATIRTEEGNRQS